MKKTETEVKNTNKFTARELELLSQVLGLDNRSATTSSFTHTLEEKFAAFSGRQFAVAQNSGTSTLHTGLMALGVGFGDEVISPAFTVIMNTATTLQCGAIPVYVDVNPETYCVCPADLKSKITKKTKAVQVVSVYGQSPEYDAIIKICEDNNVPIIEDNAECVSGYYKNRLVGTFGAFASYSFEDSKHISSGEGGIICGDNPILMEKVRKFAGHGFRTLSAGSGRIKLDPDEWQSPDFKRHDEIGFNYRISEFQSAIVLAQLERIDEIVGWRKKCGKMITAALAESGMFDIQETPDYIEHSFWCVGARFKREKQQWFQFRDKLFNNCGERVFGAWKPPYLEPTMQSGTFKRYLPNGISAELQYLKGLCPNAETIQEKMMVFKTKYRNDQALSNLLSGIKRTVSETK